jgi:hypothetical protein
MKLHTNAHPRAIMFNLHVTKNMKLQIAEKSGLIKILIQFMLFSSLIFQACGPSADDAHEYFHRIELDVDLRKLNTAYKSFSFDDKSKNELLELLNAAQAKVNKAEPFDGNDSLKNYYLDFFQTYTQLLNKEVSRMLELKSIIAEKPNSPKEADEFNQLFLSYTHKLFTADSLFCKNRKKFLRSYGDDTYVPENELNDPLAFTSATMAAYFGQSTKVTNPLLINKMNTYTLLEGATETDRENAAKELEAKIDIALTTIKTLTTDVSHRDRVIEFLEFYKKIYTEEIYPLVKLPKAEANARWPKIEQSLDSAMQVLTREDEQFAKMYNFRLTYE